MDQAQLAADGLRQGQRVIKANSTQTVTTRMCSLAEAVWLSNGSIKISHCDDTTLAAGQTLYPLGLVTYGCSTTLALAMLVGL